MAAGPGRGRDSDSRVEQEEQRDSLSSCDLVCVAVKSRGVWLRSATAIVPSPSLMPTNTDWSADLLDGQPVRLRARLPPLTHDFGGKDQTAVRQPNCGR